MPLSVHEAQAIREFTDAYLVEFKKAIETTQVKRKTPSKGSFSAPVDSSGSLAASGAGRFTGTDLEITVNGYIQYLIFGRGPSKKLPPITEIEQWMAQRGITDVSPWAIAQSIAKNGSSIFQAYKGQPSNLLESIPLDDLLNDLSNKLGEDAALQAMTDILNQFQIANLD